MSKQQISNIRYIVGVTGGIGSGKSTVTDLFAEHGIQVVDADVVAREVVAPGSNGLQQVVSAFGSKVLLANGELNRQALREIVFSNEDAKQRLNAILHPLIRTQMWNQLQNTQSEYCILAAPLLFENNMQGLTDINLVVDVSEQTQLERTLQRDGGNIATIKGIMASQFSQKQRLELADDIIDNSKDKSWLVHQVNDLHKKYTKKAQAKLKQT